MPMFMNSEVSYAKIKLDYPIWAVDFDPYNRGYLVVGGGGGESKTGVANQISVLDISNRASITTAVDIDLSRQEDSVSSLANLATKDGLITLAGINSSQANQDAGKNEHFRSFGVRYPPRKRQKTEGTASEEKGAITLLGQRSLFRPSSAAKKETYQRVLRLSPASKSETGSKRIGAVASGLAKESEIIVFNATVSTPEDADIITKIALDERAEAADLDIALADENEFSIAYCDDHNIFEQTIQYDFAKKTAHKRPNGPRRVHQIPFPDAFENPKSRPKYRAIRFLGSQNVLTLLNKPDKSGAELKIYHLYPTGPAIQVLSKNVPRHIKSAVGLDVCALDADKNGNQQFVIAVAGQDASIEVFTTDFQSVTDTFSSIKSYNTFNNVHEQQMTKLCFAPFHSPPRAPNPGEERTTGPNGEPILQQPQHPGPQYIRLASASFGNTVVVDTLPLSPLEPKNKDSRYVLMHPNDEAFWRWAYILVGAFVVLITAFLAQSFFGGFSDNTSGVFGLMPAKYREFLDQPARAAYGGAQVSKVTITSSVELAPTASIVAAHLPLADVLGQHASSDNDDGRGSAAVVVSGDEGDEFSVKIHPNRAEFLSTDKSAKQWHELAEHQRETLKKRLIDAGKWAEDEGEAVLKGCLWSTYAGLVGQAAGEVLREL